MVYDNILPDTSIRQTNFNLKKKTATTYNIKIALKIKKIKTEFDKKRNYILIYIHIYKTFCYL